MNLKWHFLIGLICSLAITFLFDLSLFQGLIIFLSSWLIDVDHYFWYAFEFKDWNPFNALKWRKESVVKWKKLSIKEKKKFKVGIFVFHSIGFWIGLLLLGVYLDGIFLFILIGVGIHMIVDWIDLISRKRCVLEKISLIYLMIKNKNKKSLKDHE